MDYECSLHMFWVLQISDRAEDAPDQDELLDKGGAPQSQY